MWANVIGCSGSDQNAFYSYTVNSVGFSSTPYHAHAWLLKGCGLCTVLSVPCISTISRIPQKRDLLSWLSDKNDQNAIQFKDIVSTCIGNDHKASQFNSTLASWSLMSNNIKNQWRQSIFWHFPRKTEREWKKLDRRRHIPLATPLSAFFGYFVKACLIISKLKHHLHDSFY